MRDRAGLLVYLAAVVAATMIHDLRLLGGGIVLVALLAGRDLPVIARRALLAVGVFNSVVTISYCILSLARGTFSAYYVALINLRVFLLTTMSFLLQRRVNLLAALAWSQTLAFLLTIAFGQVMTFRRLYEDFRLGFRSRSLLRPRWRDFYRHGAASAHFFLRRSHRDATEVTQAMAARGVFHDQS